MTTCFLAPDPIQSTQFIPGGAVPASGGQLFFYTAGSVNTKTTVYKDNAAAVAWSNPIVLDSGGNLPLGGVVWIPTGVTIKVVFAPSNDTDPPTSPYWSKDNLAGINDVAAGSASEWISGPAPTFIGATSFSVVGDQTANFTIGRRLKTTNIAGSIYSTITTVSFGVGVTTIKLVNDSGSLDAGLSAVFYSLLDPSNSSIDYYHIERKATSVASAATTDIWGINGDYVHITGTNSIFNFSSASYAGARRYVTFDSALGISSSTALTLPNNSNFTTATNDRAIIIAETVSTAIIQSYLPFSQAASTLAGITLLTTIMVANATSNVSFASSNADWASYSQYKLNLVNVVPTTSAVPLLRMSNNGGASYFSSATFYGHMTNALGANGVNYSNAQLNFHIALVNTSTNGVAITDAGISCSIDIPKPSQTTAAKSIYVSGVYSGTVAATAFTGAGITATSVAQSTAINAIRIEFSPGNISTGIFSLYGVRT